MSGKISIIIVNWNGKHHLGECLDSIRAQSYKDLELLVVDNGSTDGSVSFLKENYPETKIIESGRNLGYSGGNNRGIEKSNGKYLFLLNNDTVLDLYCLETMVRVIEEKGEECIGVFPKVNFYYEPRFINACGVVWNNKYYWRDLRIGLLDLGQYKEPEPIFGSLFPAVLVRRRQFVDIGTFDEYFFSYGEDFDVCYRANIMGYRFFLAPSAVVLHKHRASSGDNKDPLWAHYYYLRNYIIVFIKNYQLGNLLLHLPRIIWRYIFSQFIIFYKYKVRGGFGMMWRVMRDLLRALPQILRKRRWVQARRRVKDRDVWDFSAIEDNNIFHYDDAIVLSLLNLKTALHGRQAYQVEGRKYSTLD